MVSRLEMEKEDKLKLIKKLELEYFERKEFRN